MLKTHTGTRIYTGPVSWYCGNWSVPTRDIAENRPGRARQMRRMVAKARRRERRGYVPPAVKRARVVSAKRAEVRFNGEVVGYASDFKLSVDTTQFDRVHEVGTASTAFDGVIYAPEPSAWRAVLDVSNVPPAELESWKARMNEAIDSAKAFDWRMIPLDDEPETEFERAAVDVARDEVARGDVVSLNDAKVDLAGGE